MIIRNFSCTRTKLISSGTGEVRAKREPSLCNASVNGHFWSNLCLNCIFKWTWFVKADIWSVIDRSRVRFPVAAALIFLFFFPPFFSLFWLGSPSVPLECTKLANAVFQLWTPTYVFFHHFQGWGMSDPEHAFVFVDNHDNQRGHGGGGSILVCNFPFK